VVDMVAQSAVVIALLLALAFAGWAGARLGKIADAWLIAIGIAAFFLIFIGWFIIFETWWSGRTPGKRALGLRVLRDGGFPIDPGAAVIRNLVRIVELGLGFYTLSAISALISKENKRLGDLAAGTIVVRERADAVPDLDAYLARPTRADTGLSDADRILIERFLARRATLDLAARAQLARRIAARVRPTLRIANAPPGDEALLEYLAGSST